MAIVLIVWDGGTQAGTAAHLVDVPNVEEGIAVVCAWEEVMVHFSWQTTSQSCPIVDFTQPCCTLLYLHVKQLLCGQH